MLDGMIVVRYKKVKDELILDGNDNELVSRSSALINQLFFHTYEFLYQIINVLCFYICFYHLIMV